MKLLGVRLGHEGNLSYYDGEKLHYIKIERITQVKHDKLDLEDLESVLKSVWGVSLSEIDHVAVVDKWKPNTSNRRVRLVMNTNCLPQLQSLT